MAMTTVTGSPVLTPAQVHALVIQPLIDQSVAAQVSTVVTTSSHDLRVPRVTADPAAAWTAEGAEIGVTDATLDEITVTPKKLAGLVVVSNELASDSSPSRSQAQRCRSGAVIRLRIDSDASLEPHSVFPNRVFASAFRASFG